MSIFGNIMSALFGRSAVAASTTVATRVCVQLSKMIAEAK